MIKRLSFNLITFALTALCLFAPSLALSAEQLTKQEIDEIVKGIGSGVESWSGDIKGNMQQPLQGDKPLSGQDGKPLQTSDGKTIDAGLSCAQSTSVELVKATTKYDGATGKYLMRITTNIEGKSSTFSQTISGICPNGGYIVCAQDWFASNSYLCKAYQLGLSNARIVANTKDPIDNKPIPTTDCFCLDKGCGLSSGVNAVAVAQEIASYSRSLINKAYPHLTIAKEQAIGSDSYAYYISQEPTCGSKAVVALPSNNLNQLDYQARALRSQELDDNESAYSLTLAMDKGKEDAKLNEDYKQTFNTLETRTNEGLKTIDVSGNKVTYIDKQLNDNGVWTNQEGSIALANLETPKENNTCVVTYAQSTDPKTISDGSAAGASSTIVRESRYCDDNNKCPVKSGETIVANCSASNGNQGQVIAALASLDEAAEDIKCNGKEPSEANCDLDNITIFNGDAWKCGDYYPDICPYKICKCCDDNKAFWNMAQCDSSAKKLGQLKEDGNCVKIGGWTQKKGTIIRYNYKKWTGYCCFKSKLAKIIQVQGRPQVATYYQANPSRGNPSKMSWGDARNPNCKGFTPTEFQTLDFSKIDLKEFFGDIAVDSARMQEQLNNLNDHQENAGWRDNMQDKANDDNQQNRMDDADNVRDKQ
jgi:hypothetical protein